MPEGYNLDDLDDVPKYEIDGTPIEDVITKVFNKCFDEEFEKEYGMTYEDHVKRETETLCEHVLGIPENKLTDELRKLQIAARKLLDDDRL